jgi:opacity protein-like surface antigen
MFYGTGGLAWAKTEASVRGEAFSPLRRLEVAVACVESCSPISGSGFSVSDSAYHLGWAAGVGFEWMFRPNWTFGVEYLHLDFSEANYRYSTDFPNITTRVALSPGTAIKLDTDVIRATLNYRFGRP